MRNSFLDRKIPSLFALVLLIVSVVAISWMQRNGILFEGQASPETTPKDVLITNVTDSSFTVVYTTEKAAVGVLNFGKDAQNLTDRALDDQDKKTNIPRAVTAHHITITNLSPATKYFFTITSEKTAHMVDNSPFEVVTGPTLSGKSESKNMIVKGTVLVPDGSDANNVVLVKTFGSQQLSAIVSSDGSYDLSLQNLRTIDLLSYYKLIDTTKMTIQVLSGTEEASATFFAGQADPMPPVGLSQNYDFTVEGEEEEAISSASASPFSFTFPRFATDDSEAEQPTITTPTKDQGFSDLQPLFKGKATPSSDVEITIDSTTPIITTVQADSSGNWQYRPESDLPPGSHTLTVKTQDARGILQTIKQTFTVYAQGSQFTEPSVSPAASPTPTPTLSAATPTTQPAVTTTTTPAFTPTPTQSVSSPTPTTFIAPTTAVSITRAPIEEAGSSSLIAVSIATIGASIFGILLFLLSRGTKTL